MDMESTELKTEKGPQEDEVRQFSVFMENKVGRLLDIVKIFSQGRVHVVALSILDTADAAIVRLVVDDPDRARTLFQEHGFAYTEVSLVVVELSSSARRPEGGAHCAFAGRVQHPFGLFAPHPPRAARRPSRFMSRTAKSPVRCSRPISSSC